MSLVSFILVMLINTMKLDCDGHVPTLSFKPPQQVHTGE